MLLDGKHTLNGVNCWILYSDFEMNIIGMYDAWKLQPATFVTYIFFSYCSIFLTKLNKKLFFKNRCNRYIISNGNM